ncbi:MAG: CpsD/CapB family tyrosine-protein kinase [Candidatus Omnitrophica bacterium]|nr:CpsD/CapB family tyrosine-protein kinase [Candidatus Omnitrophota bacterium]
MDKFIEVIKKVRLQDFGSLKLPMLPKEFILRSAHDSTLDPHLVTHLYPKSPLAEQYRRLRENIRTVLSRENINTLAVSSSVGDEGKTLTAINLAVLIAREMDCRRGVLLVDGDLRRGRIDNALGMAPKAGLSEYLRLGADIEHILYDTPVEKLKIIPRGKIVENPTELLSSQKMRQLIQILKGRFDLVIFDTTPVIPVADALALCPMAEAVLFVIRASKTQRGVVKHALEMLQMANAHVIGYMLSGVEHYIPRYLYRYV